MISDDHVFLFSLMHSRCDTLTEWSWYADLKRGRPIKRARYGPGIIHACRLSDDSESEDEAGGGGGGGADDDEEEGVDHGDVMGMTNTNTFNTIHNY